MTWASQDPLGKVEKGAINEREKFARKRVVGPMHYVNLSNLTGPQWRFVEPYQELSSSMTWEFHSGCARNWLERRVQRPRLSHARAALSAVRALRKENSVLVSHLPKCTLWGNALRNKLARDSYHVAFSFNFTDLPSMASREIISRNLETVDEFVVFSNFERGLYSSFFDIPIGKIKFIHWSMDPPEVGIGEGLLSSQSYLCSIGGEGRDYKLLMSAAKLRPAIKFIVVARPYNVVNLDVPDNVEVFTNIPSQKVWALATSSKGLILPLRSGETPNGHVTLVAAQKLRVPLAITRSMGVSDYVDESTAFLMNPGSVSDALNAIDELYDAGDDVAVRVDNSWMRSSVLSDPRRTLKYFEDLNSRLENGV